MLRTRRFAGVLAVVVPLGVLAAPVVAYAEAGERTRVAVKEPPGNDGVTRVQNGGMLTRKNEGGKENFEYHFEVWQVRGKFAPGGRDAELTGVMQVPLSGPASLGEARGALKEGVELPFELSVAKGSTRLYLKGEKQVWVHIKADTPQGNYDHDVHLFDLEAAEKPADEPAEKPAEQPAQPPAQPPAEKPAEQPAEKPAEQPVEKPADKPAEQPAEKPAGSETVTGGTAKDAAKGGVVEERLAKDTGYKVG